jgi:chorismate mutase
MYTGGGHMEQRKLVIADLSVLPPVYHKVLKVKELLESGQAETVNEASEMADVSRSAYYKYKDYVFPKNTHVKIAIVSYWLNGTIANKDDQKNGMLNNMNMCLHVLVVVVNRLFVLVFNFLNYENRY